MYGKLLGLGNLTFACFLIGAAAENHEFKWWLGIVAFQYAVGISGLIVSALRDE